MKRRSLLSALALAGSIAGCASPGTQTIHHHRDSAAGRTIANLDATERASLDKRLQAEARRTAMEFISHARAGNVETMMRLTSPLTLKATGRTRVEQVYREQVVPTFQGATVAWNPGGKPQAEVGYAGYEFSGAARRQRAVPFYVYVFQEHGRLVVGSLSQTPRS